MLSPSVALVFSKIYFFGIMRVQEATWVDLGSIWVAQGGVKMRADKGLKRSEVE